MSLVIWSTTHNSRAVYSVEFSPLASLRKCLVEAHTTTMPTRCARSWCWTMCGVVFCVEHLSIRGKRFWFGNATLVLAKTARKCCDLVVVLPPSPLRIWEALVFTQFLTPLGQLFPHGPPFSSQHPVPTQCPHQSGRDRLAPVLIRCWSSEEDPERA